MKILLIYPYFLEDRIHAEDIHGPPIGLYSVAAVLNESHYDPEILNWHNIDKSPQRIEEVLREKQPDVIGFSVLHSNRWGAIEIAGIAKRMNPEIRIVFGGIGATFLWEYFLKHFTEVDFIVTGEGEYTFLDLIKWFEEDGKGTPDLIKGIAFRKKGKTVRTTPRKPIADLDQLPIPSKYFQYNHIASNRGCAWNCTFCGSPGFWGQKIRFRSPRHFIEELELLYKKGITFFYFSDDTFTINRKRVIEICKGIVEKRFRITWNAISRVEQVDDEVLSWMRKAGCIQISYGVESGSEEIRRALNKKIDTLRIKRAFSLTTKYGILARAYFIYGSPGETWETIQETMDLIRAIQPLSVIFYILDIFPGTDLYKRYQRKFHVTDDIWLNRIEGIMYFETEPQLTEEMILDFGKKLRTDYYEKVHRFVDSIQLINDEEFYEMHADFCSRLGMTFSHGDYSRIEAVKEKSRTAEKLYRKALSYYPNHRAYLGLGIILQQKSKFEESIKILSIGLEFFPESIDLNLSLGISYMNTGQYEKAIGHFKKFPDSKEANHQIAICYRELGDSEKESVHTSS